MEALMNIEQKSGLRRVESPDPPGTTAESPGAEGDLDALRALLAASGDPAHPLELRRWVDLAEAWYITRTLRAVRGNRSEAARVLGIGRRTLYAKMQKLGIEASWRLTPRP